MYCNSSVIVFKYIHIDSIIQPLKTHLGHRQMSESCLPSEYTFVSDIKYDLDGMKGFDHYWKKELGMSKQEKLDTLPKTLKVHRSWFEDCFEDYQEVNSHDPSIKGLISMLNSRIRKCIEEEFGWLCAGFTYTVFKGEKEEQIVTFKDVPFKNRMKELGKIMDARDKEQGKERESGYKNFDERMDMFFDSREKGK